MHNDKELIFTGHSLGGALAIIAGERFSREYKLSPNQLKIITFSAPRVGGDDFVKRTYGTITRENILNFVCGGDAVPKVPLRKMMKYSDIGIVVDVLSIEQVWSKAVMGVTYFRDGRMDVRKHVLDRFYPYLKPFVMGAFVMVTGYVFGEPETPIIAQTSGAMVLSAIMEYSPILKSIGFIHHEIPTKSTVRIAWATTQLASKVMDPDLYSVESNLSSLSYNRHPILWWIYRKFL